MSDSIGYYDYSYDIHSNWDYKKKRNFKKKPLPLANFNTILLIILISIPFYILSHFCISNFYINNSTDSSTNNLCFNFLIYILSFKNFYLSIFLYFFIISYIIYILYYFNIFQYFFHSFPYYYDIVQYCSILSLYNIKDTYYNLTILYKNKEYYKIYIFFNRIIILIIMLISFLSLIIYFLYFIYQSYN